MKFYTLDELRKNRSKSSGARSSVVLSSTGPDTEYWMIDFADFSREQLFFLEDISISHKVDKYFNIEPLRNCTRLQEFRIVNTNLLHIDLSPFEGKPLRKISLQSNMLQEIDLEPLINCKSLKAIYLTNNMLKTIDLSPLKDLPELEVVALAGNQLNEIDLSPLEGKPIKWLALSSFKQYDEINFSPLYKNNKLERITYSLADVEGEEFEPFVNDKRLIYYQKWAYYHLPEENVSATDISYRDRIVRREQICIKSWEEGGDQVIQVENDLHLHNSYN